MKTASVVLVTVLLLSLGLGIGPGWSLATLLSAMLTVTVLALARLSMEGASPVRSAGALFLLYWGLSFVSNLLEAAYFHILPGSVVTSGAAAGAGIAVVTACMLTLFLSPRQVIATPLPGTSVGGTPQSSLPRGAALAPSALAAGDLTRDTSLATGLWWRIPMLCLCFFFIYLAAGIAVFPWIKAFYASKPLPSIGALFRLQCLRGLLDLVCVLPWLSLYRGSRLRAAALSAGIFVVLCAWAPLLLPNAYLPLPIRIAHAAEMGASGIVFGALAARVLLRRSQARGSATTEPAGAPADSLVRPA